MITGKHSILRNADADDVHEFKALYKSGIRSGLLNRRKEMIEPTLDEIREMLSVKDAKQKGMEFSAAESLDGKVLGFCSIRQAKVEPRYSTFILMLLDDAMYDTPFAEEVSDFLLREAFVRGKAPKVLAHCLDTQPHLRRFLVEHGFQSNGVLRGVIYSGGKWHDSETLTLFSQDYMDKQYASEN